MANLKFILDYRNYDTKQRVKQVGVRRANKIRENRREKKYRFHQTRT